MKTSKANKQRNQKIMEKSILKAVDKVVKKNFDKGSDNDQELLLYYSGNAVLIKPRTIFDSKENKGNVLEMCLMDRPVIDLFEGSGKKKTLKIRTFDLESLSYLGMVEKPLSEPKAKSGKTSFDKEPSKDDETIYPPFLNDAFDCEGDDDIPEDAEFIEEETIEAIDESTKPVDDSIVFEGIMQACNIDFTNKETCEKILDKLVEMSSEQDGWMNQAICEKAKTFSGFVEEIKEEALKEIQDPNINTPDEVLYRLDVVKEVSPLTPDTKNNPNYTTELIAEMESLIEESKEKRGGKYSTDVLYRVIKRGHHGMFPRAAFINECPDASNYTITRMSGGKFSAKSFTPDILAYMIYAMVPPADYETILYRLQDDKAFEPYPDCEQDAKTEILEQARVRLNSITDFNNLINSEESLITVPKSGLNYGDLCVTMDEKLYSYDFDMIDKAPLSRICTGTLFVIVPNDQISETGIKKEMTYSDIFTREHPFSSNLYSHKKLQEYLVEEYNVGSDLESPSEKARDAAWKELDKEFTCVPLKLRRIYEKFTEGENTNDDK